MHYRRLLYHTAAKKQEKFFAFRKFFQSVPRKHAASAAHIMLEGKMILKKEKNNRFPVQQNAALNRFYGEGRLGGTAQVHAHVSHEKSGYVLTPGR
jgi:hypothetical protein